MSAPSPSGKLALVAIGGNAIIKSKAALSIPDQYDMVRQVAVNLADMIEAGWNLVVTHGNGPQVGFIMRRSELSMPEVDPVPMDYAGADIQGAVGYMFCKALRNEFRARGIQREVIAVVTQTLVDAHDPAFAAPSKPIGSWFGEEDAKEKAAQYGWHVAEDAGRGWRRVVPSPAPKHIVESGVIHSLTKAGHVVVALGGGGIPVVETADGDLAGVEAVIDKDFASGLLARELGASFFMLPTGVDRVALGYGTAEQRWLDTLTSSEARELCRKGSFDKGSMEPKITALADFVAATGNPGVITSLPLMRDALEGKAGTRVIPG